MNPDLYNFHTLVQTPSSSGTSHPKASASHSGLDHTPTSSQFCHSWNEGHCRWPFGGSAMPVKIAKGIIAVYPAPFGCPGPLGVPGPLLHLEANVDSVKSDTPQLVNSVHTLDSLRFSSSRSSSLFVCPSLSQPGPSYPLSSSFSFSCPASSPSGTSSPIQGSHPLFLPSSAPCSSSRSEQGVYPLCTSAEIPLPTSAISLSVHASTTEVPYQTVVCPSRPLLPRGAPPLEPSPLEDHLTPLHLPAMVSPIRVDRLELG